MHLADALTTSGIAGVWHALEKIQEVTALRLDKALPAGACRFH